ncbi:MAG: FGGY-family carbohydrate kinase, partial [Bacteroidota bacterium]
PELFNNAAKFISIKEYIIYKLTGEYVVDYSIASASGLFNPVEKCWHAEVLREIGIDNSQLSTICTPKENFKLLKSVTEELSLPEDILLISGGSDGCLANLGDEATSQGIYSISIGTSGAVRTVSKNFITDSKMRLFSYILDEDMFIHGGAVNTGAIALEWLGKQVFGNKQASISPKEIIGLAATAQPGANGLLFLPYLQGERAPFWEPEMTGSFLGLTIDHDQKHFARAIIEGVLYNLNYVMEAVAKVHPKVSLIKASGGFTKSAFWLQMLADITNCSVEVNTGTASAARGAAILGWEVLKNDRYQFKSGENSSEKYLPNPKKHQTYRTYYEQFVKLIQKK